ncbi:MAG TPA: proton-conducting transporter membrane subunit [Thermoanaerobaculia bacterium]|jgi:hydrogenase-4 component B|nr:proton-conducting transporter membrane subunit [Thermoanaerobaculia bacterium]
MSAILVLTGIVLCMVSGLPTLYKSGKRKVEGRNMGRSEALLPSAFCLLLSTAGSITGLAGCAIGLVTAPAQITLPWLVPGGAMHLRVDALSAFFAAPVFLLAGVGNLYAQRYWPASRDRAVYLRVFFGLMTGALALVMTAANTLLFIAAWEIVSIASFFLIVTEHEKAETRRAGWIYLASSHVATMALFAVVALLHTLTRTWAFTPLASGTGALPAGRALFWLAAIAFGMKAGVMPLHVWLPGAHAAAPSHVSAVMSGVVIKIGIYGLVRVLTLFDVIPSSFGVTILLAGIASSILGVAFALAQHDLKRLLAYHSIENIGIIVTGLGIGVIAQAHGQPLIALLGYAGALLHVWNHGLFKALLFLSAGAAIHAVHTREIDRMGGLGRLMPWTSAAFLAGAVAITGLPPLNGFVSEWLLYVAGFMSNTTPARGGPILLLILVVPALALTGALALACFVKAFGVVFLGSPRTADAAHASEAPRTMRLAMLPLVLACAAIGLLPAWLVPLLGRVIAVAAPRLAQPRNLLAFLQPIQTTALVIAAVAAIAVLAMIAATRRAATAVTWDCGYAQPTPRMQYTASSVARGLVGFFSWAMPPVVHEPPPFPLFPAAASFESHVPDTVLDRTLLPSLRGIQWFLGFARYFQHGRVQLYLLYIGATLVALLAWSAW